MPNPGITVETDDPKKDRKKGEKGQKTTNAPTLSAVGENQKPSPRNPLVPPKHKATKSVTLGLVGENVPDVPLAVVGKRTLNADGITDAEYMEEEEFAKPEITNAEVLAGLVPGTLQPIAEPRYRDDLFDPSNSVEDLIAMLRLHQLNNQVATQELRLASEKHLTQSISEIAQQSDAALIKNLTKQATRTTNTDHFRPDHYAPEGFSLLSQVTENIHRNLTTSQEGNKTIITLSPIQITDTAGAVVQEIPRTVTTWPEEDKNRIMISASGTDVYSLVVLIEKALKTAKAMYPTKASFVIFIPPKNPANMKEIAQLCAMANFVGLTPIFQTKDGCTREDAIKFQENFIQDIGRPETINCSLLTKKQESNLTEKLNKLGLNPIYKPPEYTKLTRKP